MRGFFNCLFSRLTISLTLIAAYLSAIIFLCFYIPSLLSIGAAIVGVYALSAAVSLSAINRDAPPEYKCAWLCFIAAVPVVGAVMYIIFQYRRQPCGRTLTFVGESVPPPISYDQCEYFSDGAGYFERLFGLIDGAKKRVYLEYYIIADGEIYSRLHDCLKRALERGVKVRLIADGLGSALRLPVKRLKELEGLGAELIIFNRLSPLPVSRINFRDHRKIAAIDGEYALSGGINIADEYAGITSPHGYWKDTGFCVSGNAATFFEELFLSVWLGDREIFPPEIQPEYAKDGNICPKGAKLSSGREISPSEKQSQHAKDGNICPDQTNSDSPKMLPVYDSPPVQSGLCEDVICSAIYSAKSRVWAFTPYLCLDERLKRAFCFAAQTGADVTVIIPHVPDKKLTFRLTSAYARELVESGVKVYEYTPGFMHAKCLICDDKCLLGTYNLDFRSMSLNLECGGIFGGQVSEEVAADFCACLALSEPMPNRKNRLAALLKLFAPLA
ncbi:MAG: phospholipase D-like domain-containing protein [Candidatus Coproplasma sp.]